MTEELHHVAPEGDVWPKKQFGSELYGLLGVPEEQGTVQTLSSDDETNVTDESEWTKSERKFWAEERLKAYEAIIQQSKAELTEEQRTAGMKPLIYVEPKSEHNVGRLNRMTGNDRMYARPFIAFLNTERERGMMIEMHQAEGRRIRAESNKNQGNQSSVLSAEQLVEAKRLSDGITAQRPGPYILSGEGNQGKSLITQMAYDRYKKEVATYMVEAATRKAKKTKPEVKPKSENVGHEKCNRCGKLTPRKGSCFDCLNKSMFS